ncbi:MAG TPA: FtsX-like permease family protein, partial [Ohtaekwangia sp.]
MSLSLFIARRYLFSTRKKNFINIISLLAVVGVAFSTAALVIILSVFNGLEDLLRSLNNAFDPEIKIEAAEGKSFVVSDSLLQSIKKTPGVSIVTEVIEDYAYVRYRDATQVVTLKGVSDNFLEQNRIPKRNIVQGELRLKKGNIRYAIAGQGISNTLSLAVEDPMFALQIYYIKNVKSASVDPSSMYSHMSIVPGGVFSIIQNIDDNYILVPLDFSQELLNYGDKRTSLEIKVTDHDAISDVKNSLEKTLGKTFHVLNQEEQHKDLYRLLKMEKLFTFLTFTLLLGIASINIFFSLMMLAIDKKKDISILTAMGASPGLIKRIFLYEGILIAISGALFGVIIGGVICWIQQTSGLVSMGMENAVTPGYPIKMVWTDFALTMAVVSLLTILISARPATIASR